MAIGNCPICKWWRRYPYKRSEKDFFEAKVREGVSLRKLELLLESYGVRAKKDTIAKHIHQCLDIEIQSQRKAEKELQKEKRGTLRRKLSHIFSRPPIEIKKKCEHLRTVSFWDIVSECVRCRCLDCNEVLKGQVDFKTSPLRRKSEEESKNWLLLEALINGNK